ncbi:DNA mismatch endonuclease Vsr [Desulfurivibrio sp. D14AmB]|uniref:DNA mismatch endonuclease Vsr n=1 Tax=Desulfurivibrio sp. D14AmB TaxID=3374370 RepID=UPI00376EFE07
MRWILVRIMTDILDEEKRSTLMSKVRSADTKPEWILRCGLHRLGLRYRLGDRRLPGKPDLVFPMCRAAVFVHGCYWHRHQGCNDASTPKTKAAFWQEKFAENVARDRRVKAEIERLGWRVLVVWECELLRDTVATVHRVARWLRSESAAEDGVAAKESGAYFLDRRELLAAAEKKVRYRIDSYAGREDEATAAGRSRKAESLANRPFAVVDLFSGAGGMSYGFHRHPSFKVVGAADAELGKPSVGKGKLQCNGTYGRNIGICPTRLDLTTVPPTKLRETLGLPADLHISVLSSCPPCTGFSRANPDNHLRDDRRNSLVRRSAEFAVALDVDIVMMENARELIRGNFKHHYEWFREFLENHGYNVFGRTYLLSRFGLPQIRERAIVIAVKQNLPLHTLESLWDGWTVADEAITVRRTFATISPDAEGSDLHPDFSSEAVRRRIMAIPKDGGSWVDLLSRPDADYLLTDAMKRIVSLRRFGSYPDVYGRMAWDRPAPTIKRECSHVGNGRYAHPEENRLCTVRELAALQGFPDEFVFNGAAVSNMYRHIGDAVPPLVSYQLAHLAHWILTGEQPKVTDVLLPGTNLRPADIVKKKQGELFDG